MPELTVSHPGLSATHPAANAPNKGEKGLFICLVNNGDLVNTRTKCPTKEWAITVSTGGTSTGSLSEGLPRGEQSILAGRACLGLCSSHPAAPKITSLWGSKEGKESRDPTGDGWMIFSPRPVGTEGTLEPWNGRQESNTVPEPLCKSQCLHSHSSVILCVILNLLSSNLNWRNRGPSCNPWQFTSLRKHLLKNSMPYWKKLPCNSTSSEKCFV